MPTEAEIKAKYKKLHDDLTERYYQRHELSKEEFDAQHGKIWADMEAELKASGFKATVYRYGAFSKEVTHHKRDTPIYVDYEVLEFNQELTDDEISSLEVELGKTIRKLQ